VNEFIRIPQIRLIDENGAQIGVVATSEARRIAQERGYDLVEVSPNSSPPVCRIMDYGKFVYELQKKAKVAKKKQHTIQQKEIRFRPKIEEHDYEFKLRHIIDFLQQGFSVKLLIMFRGRELAHKEMGFKVIDRLREDLVSYGKFEVQGKMEERTITAMVTPQSGAKHGAKEQKESQ